MCRLQEAEVEEDGQSGRGAEGQRQRGRDWRHCLSRQRKLYVRNASMEHTMSCPQLCLKGETLIWSEHNEDRTHMGVQVSLGDSTEQLGHISSGVAT